MALLQKAIQCTDRASAQVGSFIHKGDFIAISPVFNSLVQLFAWMKTSGFESVPGSYTKVREVTNG
jgi:hypothetical protein